MLRYYKEGHDEIVPLQDKKIGTARRATTAASKPRVQFLMERMT